MESDAWHYSEWDPQSSILRKKDFEELYRLYWKRLYDFALMKTGDRDVSEEIVQDLFVTLWEKRDALQISNFQSYLFVSVRNRIITYHKQKIFVDLNHAEATVAPDYPLFLEEFESSLNEVIGQLPQKTHEIFMLNRFEGKSAQEISKKLKIPTRTVEYHITQALRHLKDLLKQSLILFLAFLNGITF